MKSDCFCLLQKECFRRLIRELKKGNPFWILL